MAAVDRTGAVRVDPRGRNQITGRLLAAPLLIFILLPVLAIFFRLTPADVLTSLQDRTVLQAVRLSLSTTLITVVISILAGTPVAYLLHRRKSRFFHFIDTLIDLPVVLPPSVAGVALLMAFGRQGLLGGAFSALGVSIPFTTAAVVLAQTFIAAPLYVKSAAVGFSAVDEELKNAAALDGADRWQAFRYVMLPMSWPSILSGCALTWARALGEFGATIIFAGNFSGRTQTMPLAIYIGFELELATALTLSALLVLLSFLVLITVKVLLHRRMLVSMGE
jgi:molybdate transport system permease protein